MSLSRHYISDLILLQDPHTKRISAILDANSPAWFRTPPKSLTAEIKRVASVCGCISKPIRCPHCGKRTREKLIYPNHCKECSDSRELRLRDQPIKSPYDNGPYVYPEDWREGRDY